MANKSARAAIVFSPPDKLDIGWNLFPGATQLQEIPSRYGSSGFSEARYACAEGFFAKDCNKINKFVQK